MTKEENRSVVLYRIEKDERGVAKFIPKYLIETPQYEIDRLNTEFAEWKK